MIPQSPEVAQRCAKCRLQDALRMESDAQKRVLELDPVKFAESRQSSYHFCEEHAA